MNAEQTAGRAVRRDADNGVIVFDPTRVPQVESRWFDFAWWRGHGLLRTRSAGRGAIGFIDSPAGAIVLRHFRRGGLLAKLRGDRYLWLGAERSRGFREFDLLQWMQAHGLPVPVPLAARVRRAGLAGARADLITAELAGAQSLAERLRQDGGTQVDWKAVGALVARFHAAGVFHADLNAHNILWSGDSLYLIDFDRGGLRRPARGWQQANLRRLRRSILKVAPEFGRDLEGFERVVWQPLLRGYGEMRGDA